MKKVIKAFLITIVSIVVLVVAALLLFWGGEIRTLGSVGQVGDNEYLYQMEYRAAYDLDEVIENDIDSNARLIDYIVAKIGKGLPITISSSQVSESDVANCTSFQAARTDGTGFWFGRNYDFYKNPTMVTFSRPEKGYASIAVSDMSHFGYSLDKLPSSFAGKIMCLASIYAPVDGINEKGLCTSIMALPRQASQQNSGKHAVGTTIIMRLFLDRCATVSEALDLLSTVDVRHDAAVGYGYHYMVADASGDCAIIEFDKDDQWKTMILRKEEGKNSMHITNHLLDPKYRTDVPDPSVGNPASMSWERYAKVEQFMEQTGGVLTLEQAQQCLASVRWVDLPIEGTDKMENTQYSNVYDQSSCTLYLRDWNQYDVTRTFSLER